MTVQKPDLELRYLKILKANHQSGRLVEDYSLLYSILVSPVQPEAGGT